MNVHGYYVENGNAPTHRPLASTEEEGGGGGEEEEEYAYNVVWT